MSNENNFAVTVVSSVALVGIGFAIMAVSEPGAAAPATQVPKCPDVYPVEGIELTHVPDGWVGNVGDDLTLDFVTVVEGVPVAKNRVVAEVEVAKTKEGLEVGYANLHKNPKPYWLSCIYGKMKTVQLYRSLPESFKRCSVKYVMSPNNNEYLLSNYTCS